MWSCKECHQIYHYTCARRRFVGNLMCPTCKRTPSAPTVARCWCGKQDHGAFNLLGNSFGFLCGKTLSCDSPGTKCNKSCNNTCHPGPCEPVTCGNDCLSKQMTEIIIQETPLGGQSQTQNPPQEASRQSGGQAHSSDYSNWVSLQSQEISDVMYVFELTL